MDRRAPSGIVMVMFARGGERDTPYDLMRLVRKRMKCGEVGGVTEPVGARLLHQGILPRREMEPQDESERRAAGERRSEGVWTTIPGLCPFGTDRPPL